MASPGRFDRGVRPFSKSLGTKVGGKVWRPPYSRSPTVIARPSKMPTGTASAKS